MYKLLKVNVFSYNPSARADRRGIHHGYLNQTVGIRDQVDELI